MTSKFLFIVVFAFLGGLRLPRVNAEIPRIIIDQDMSSDYDDVGDLYTLDALANLGECKVLACMSDTPNGATPLCMNAINTYFGMPNVPVGVRPDVDGPANYPANVAAEFPHPLYQTAKDCPLAVDLYRKILASQPDHSVTIVTTGYLTNVEALLKSGSDQYSSLSGVDLVAKKVKLLSCAGGAYPSGTEFDFMDSMDDSAYYVINNWPTAATYIDFLMGAWIDTGGDLALSGTNNPARRVWQLNAWGPHGSWGQIAVYNAVRGSQGMWNFHGVGRNNCVKSGSNYWTDTPNPGNQAYTLEVSRYPIVQCLNALINMPPNNGAPAPPGQPSFIRTTVVSGSEIDLKWNSNSFNENGFWIERRANGGVFTPLAKVGAKVTSYADRTVPSDFNCGYRLKAYNARGESNYAYAWVYSPWTEHNFSKASDLPLYTYVTPGDLRMTNPSAADHVTINNDSTHGQDLAINVEVGTRANQGSYYIYFFYQDQNNWYRLNVTGTSSQFQKSVDGTVTSIGAAGPGVMVAGLEFWQVVVTHAGSLQFYAGSRPTLNVTDALSLGSGKIGLGGAGNFNPLWENFNFDPSGLQPTGLTPKGGAGAVTLGWNPSKGATSYNVYQGVADGDVQSTPIAVGITGTSYTDYAVIGGSKIAYFYQVAAVNSSGTTSFSNEASAVPNAAGTAVPPTGLAAVSGIDQISLHWDASKGAMSYNVYRGNSSSAEGTAPLATGVGSPSYVDDNAVGGDTYYYAVAAVNTSGTSAMSNEASGVALASGSSTVAFLNPSFESVPANGYSYKPADSGWTFTNLAGIQQNGSPYSGVLPVAPDGTQTAFVQSSGTSLGTMSQKVNFPAGTYTIRFYAAQRNDQLQPIKITVDDKELGIYKPTSNNYILITTAPFTVTAGDHTVTFAATDSSGDKTSFIDVVRISTAASIITAPYETK